MSIHIGAKADQIASTVLLPGDPLRAKYIAETFLEDPFCYNEVRGMYGYTGKYNGKKVSVQGSGMGMPSLSIYVNELISEFNVNKIIRVGSCGSLQPDLDLRDIILGISASSNANLNNLRFDDINYAPTASFQLLMHAWQAAEDLGIPYRVGPILSSDLFYQDDMNRWKKWAQYGILAVEMEAAELYTLGAKFGIDTLAILTVSDSIVTGHQTSSEDREKTFSDMIHIALKIA
ncbi:MAG: purine-nucleoside phosphorylase [Spirochaetales bacterium]|nr:purine-nucleoside phosphorylase [Spirochaetales bacterium]